VLRICEIWIIATCFGFFGAHDLATMGRKPCRDRWDSYETRNNSILSFFIDSMSQTMAQLKGFPFLDFFVNLVKGDTRFGQTRVDHWM
jgi:hypothetical protein